MPSLLSFYLLGLKFRGMVLQTTEGCLTLMIFYWTRGALGQSAGYPPEEPVHQSPDRVLRLTKGITWQKGIKVYKRAGSVQSRLCLSCSLTTRRKRSCARRMKSRSEDSEIHKQAQEWWGIWSRKNGIQLFFYFCIYLVLSEEWLCLEIFCHVHLLQLSCVPEGVNYKSVYAQRCSSGKGYA